jgi:LemA protein
METGLIQSFWRRLALILGFTGVLMLSGCGYNDIQASDEGVKSAWSEVVNQYKRRADLIPNLVETVKGYADQEKEVLTSVTEARAKASQTQVNIDPSNPAALEQFSKAQSNMSSALSRLLVTVEKYPELKSDANFRELQAQLEGTENRISVARNRYIESVQGYNTLIRQIPVNLTAMVMGYKEKPQFTVADEAAVAEPPKVDFKKPATTN